MAAAMRLVGIVGILAFASASIYSIWFKGYGPAWPIQLAWEGIRAATAGSSKKIWMVAEFVDANGRSGAMSFNNPAISNLTLAECKRSIEAARPHILGAVRQTAGAVNDITLTCVASDGDPIRP